MSLLDFINVLLGNYQPAFISFFNKIDDEGYPVEEGEYEDDEEEMFDEEDFDEEEEEMFDDEEEPEDETEDDPYSFGGDDEGDYE